MYDFHQAYNIWGIKQDLLPLLFGIDHCRLQ